MRIGLLITSIGNFGQKGFYNAQEVGLAKALDKLVDEVTVYKLISVNQGHRIEQIEGCRNANIQFIPTKSFGINGKLDVALLDTTLDAVVYFSDTQVAVPQVYKWAFKNHVALYPYIGVVESHSTNRFKKWFVDLMFKRNLSVYRKSHCFVKTPTVEKKLRTMGVNDITVTPVGLDLDLLKLDFENYDPLELKKKYGYRDSEKVLLFIGRLIEEKQPVRMIEILAELVKKEDSYKLFMVGTGKLKKTVETKIEDLGIMNYVQMVDRISNSDIWELYRIADSFINLNQQEIFGMAILEAMYYGCKVVAWEAPGPSFIIENGVSGWIVDNDQQVIKKIEDGTSLGEEAYNRAMKAFMWDSTAKKMYAVIGDN